MQPFKGRFWRRGFTGLEVLVVLAVVVSLALGVYTTTRPDSQNIAKQAAGNGCCGSWDCGGNEYCAGASCVIENGQVKSGFGVCVVGENRPRATAEIIQDVQQSGGNSEAASNAQSNLSSGLPTTSTAPTTVTLPNIPAGVSAGGRDCSFCGNASQGACDNNPVTRNGQTYTCSFGCNPGSGLVFCSSGPQAGSCRSSCPGGVSEEGYGPTSSNPVAAAQAESIRLQTFADTVVTGNTSAIVAECQITPGCSCGNAEEAQACLFSKLSPADTIRVQQAASANQALINQTLEVTNLCKQVSPNNPSCNSATSAIAVLNQEQQRLAQEITTTQSYRDYLAVLNFCAKNSAGCGEVDSVVQDPNGFLNSPAYKALDAQNQRIILTQTAVQIALQNPNTQATVFGKIGLTGSEQQAVAAQITQLKEQQTVRLEQGLAALAGGLTPDRLETNLGLSQAEATQVRQVYQQELDQASLARKNQAFTALLNGVSPERIDTSFTLTASEKENVIKTYSSYTENANKYLACRPPLNCNDLLTNIKSLNLLSQQSLSNLVNQRDQKIAAETISTIAQNAQNAFQSPDAVNRSATATVANLTISQQLIFQTLENDNLISSLLQQGSESLIISECIRRTSNRAECDDVYSARGLLTGQVSNPGLRQQLQDATLEIANDNGYEQIAADVNFARDYQRNLDTVIEAGTPGQPGYTQSQCTSSTNLKVVTTTLFAGRAGVNPATTTNQTCTYGCSNGVCINDAQDLPPAFQQFLADHAFEGVDPVLLNPDIARRINTTSDTETVVNYLTNSKLTTPREVNAFVIKSCMGQTSSCLAKYDYQGWSDYKSLTEEGILTQNQLQELATGRNPNLPTLIKTQIDLIYSDPVNAAWLTVNKWTGGLTAKAALGNNQNLSEYRTIVQTADITKTDLAHIPEVLSGRFANWLDDTIPGDGDAFLNTYMTINFTTRTFTPVGWITTGISNTGEFVYDRINQTINPDFKPEDTVRERLDTVNYSYGANNIIVAAPFASTGVILAALPAAMLIAPAGVPVMGAISLASTAFGVYGTVSSLTPVAYSCSYQPRFEGQFNLGDCASASLQASYMALTTAAGAIAGQAQSVAWVAEAKALNNPAFTQAAIQARAAALVEQAVPTSTQAFAANLGTGASVVGTPAFTYQAIRECGGLFAGDPNSNVFSCFSNAGMALASGSRLAITGVQALNPQATALQSWQRLAGVTGESADVFDGLGSCFNNRFNIGECFQGALDVLLDKGEILGGTNTASEKLKTSYTEALAQLETAQANRIANPNSEDSRLTFQNAIETAAQWQARINQALLPVTQTGGNALALTNIQQAYIQADAQTRVTYVGSLLLAGSQYNIERTLLAFDTNGQLQKAIDAGYNIGDDPTSQYLAATVSVLNNVSKSYGQEVANQIATKGYVQELFNDRLTALQNTIQISIDEVQIRAAITELTNLNTAYKETLGQDHPLFASLLTQAQTKVPNTATAVGPAPLLPAPATGQVPTAVTVSVPVDAVAAIVAQNIQDELGEQEIIAPSITLSDPSVTDNTAVSQVAPVVTNVVAPGFGPFINTALETVANRIDALLTAASTPPAPLDTQPALADLAELFNLANQNVSPIRTGKTTANAKVVLGVTGVVSLSDGLETVYVITHRTDVNSYNIYLMDAQGNLIVDAPQVAKWLKFENGDVRYAGIFVETLPRVAANRAETLQAFQGVTPNFTVDLSVSEQVATLAAPITEASAINLAQDILAGESPNTEDVVEAVAEVITMASPLGPPINDLVEGVSGENLPPLIAGIVVGAKNTPNNLAAPTSIDTPRAFLPTDTLNQVKQSFELQLTNGSLTEAGLEGVLSQISSWAEIYPEVFVPLLETHTGMALQQPLIELINKTVSSGVVNLSDFEGIDTFIYLPTDQLETYITLLSPFVSGSDNPVTSYVNRAKSLLALRRGEKYFPGEITLKLDQITSALPDYDPTFRATIQEQPHTVTSGHTTTPVYLPQQLRSSPKIVSIGVVTLEESGLIFERLDGVNSVQVSENNIASIGLLAADTSHGENAQWVRDRVREVGTIDTYYYVELPGGYKRVFPTISTKGTGVAIENENIRVASSDDGVVSDIGAFGTSSLSDYGVLSQQSAVLEEKIMNALNFAGGRGTFGLAVIEFSKQQFFEIMGQINPLYAQAARNGEKIYGDKLFAVVRASDPVRLTDSSDLSYTHASLAEEYRLNREQAFRDHYNISQNIDLSVLAQPYANLSENQLGEFLGIMAFFHTRNVALLTKLGYGDSIPLLSRDIGASITIHDAELSTNRGSKGELRGILSTLLTLYPDHVQSILQGAQEGLNSVATVSSSSPLEPLIESLTNTILTTAVTAIAPVLGPVVNPAADLIQTALNDGVLNKEPVPLEKQLATWADLIAMAQQRGIRLALTGSTASYLTGGIRPPTDIDLVFDDTQAELVRQLIIDYQTQNLDLYIIRDLSVYPHPIYNSDHFATLQFRRDGLVFQIEFMSNFKVTALQGQLNIVGMDTNGNPTVAGTKVSSTTTTNSQGQPVEIPVFAIPPALEIARYMATSRLAEAAMVPNPFTSSSDVTLTQDGLISSAQLPDLMTFAMAEYGIQLKAEKDPAQLKIIFKEMLTRYFGYTIPDTISPEKQALVNRINDIFIASLETRNAETETIQIGLQNMSLFLSTPDTRYTFDQSATYANFKRTMSQNLINLYGGILQAKPAEVAFVSIAANSDLAQNKMNSVLTLFDLLPVSESLKDQAFEVLKKIDSNYNALSDTEKKIISDQTTDLISQALTELEVYYQIGSSEQLVYPITDEASQPNADTTQESQVEIIDTQSDTPTTPVTLPASQEFEETLVADSILPEIEISVQDQLLEIGQTLYLALPTNTQILNFGVRIASPLVPHITNLYSWLQDFAGLVSSPTILSQGQTTHFGGPFSKYNGENQDFVISKAGVNIIADGAGGHAGGKLAAETAGNAAILAIDPEGDPTIELMKAVDVAQNALAQRKANGEVPTEAISTFTTALLHQENGQNYVYIINVGDSKNYLLRKNELIDLTLDQEVQQIYPLVDSKYNIFKDTPHGKALINAIGVEKSEKGPRFLTENIQTINKALAQKPSMQGKFIITPEGNVAQLTKVRLLHGDRILQASDGLPDLLSTEEIIGTINTSKSPQEASDTLIDLAINKSVDAGGNPLGGRNLADNVSASLIFADKLPTLSTPTNNAPVVPTNTATSNKAAFTMNSLGNMSAEVIARRNIESYKSDEKNYGPISNPLEFHKKWDQVYDFQNQIMSTGQELAQGKDNNYQSTKDAVLKYLKDSGIEVKVYSLKEMNYFNDLLAKGEGTLLQVFKDVEAAKNSNTLPEIPLSLKARNYVGFHTGSSLVYGQDLWGRPKQTVIVLDEEGYGQINQITNTIDQKIMFLQKIGHEGGHAIDSLFGLYGSKDANWATEILQKEFNAQYWKAVNQVDGSEYAAYLYTQNAKFVEYAQNDAAFIEREISQFRKFINFIAPKFKVQQTSHPEIVLSDTLTNPEVSTNVNTVVGNNTALTFAPFTAAIHPLLPPIIQFIGENWPALTTQFEVVRAFLPTWIQNFKLPWQESSTSSQSQELAVQTPTELNLEIQAEITQFIRSSNRSKEFVNLGNGEWSIRLLPVPGTATIYQLVNNTTQVKYAVKPLNQRSQVDLDNFNALPEAVKASGIISPIVYVSENKSFFLSPYIEGLEGDAIFANVDPEQVATEAIRILKIMADNGLRPYDITLFMGHNVIWSDGKLTVIESDAYDQKKVSSQKIIQDQFNAFLRGLLSTTDSLQLDSQDPTSLSQVSKNKVVFMYYLLNKAQALGITTIEIPNLSQPRPPITIFTTPIDYQPSQIPLPTSFTDFQTVLSGLLDQRDGLIQEGKADLRPQYTLQNLTAEERANLAKQVTSAIKSISYEDLSQSLSPELNFIERTWGKIPTPYRITILQILLGPLGSAFQISSSSETASPVPIPTKQLLNVRPLDDLEQLYLENQAQRWSRSRETLASKVNTSDEDLKHQTDEIINYIIAHNGTVDDTTPTWIRRAMTTLAYLDIALPLDAQNSPNVTATIESVFLSNLLTTKPIFSALSSSRDYIQTATDILNQSLASLGHSNVFIPLSEDDVVMTPMEKGVAAFYRPGRDLIAIGLPHFTNEDSSILFHENTHRIQNQNDWRTKVSFQLKDQRQITALSEGLTLFAEQKAWEANGQGSVLPGLPFSYQVYLDTVQVAFRNRLQSLGKSDAEIDSWLLAGGTVDPHGLANELGNGDITAGWQFINTMTSTAVKIINDAPQTDQNSLRHDPTSINREGLFEMLDAQRTSGNNDSETGITVPGVNILGISEELDRNIAKGVENAYRLFNQKIPIDDQWSITALPIIGNAPTYLLENNQTGDRFVLKPASTNSSDLLIFSTLSPESQKSKAINPILAFSPSGRYILSAYITGYETEDFNLKVDAREAAMKSSSTLLEAAKLGIDVSNDTSFYDGHNIFYVTEGNQANQVVIFDTGAYKQTQGVSVQDLVSKQLSRELDSLYGRLFTFDYPADLTNGKPELSKRTKQQITFLYYFLTTAAKEAGLETISIPEVINSRGWITTQLVERPLPSTFADFVDHLISQAIVTQNLLVSLDGQRWKLIDEKVLTPQELVSELQQLKQDSLESIPLQSSQPSNQALYALNPLADPNSTLTKLATALGNKVIDLQIRLGIRYEDSEGNLHWKWPWGKVFVSMNTQPEVQTPALDLNLARKGESERLMAQVIPSLPTPQKLESKYINSAIEAKIATINQQTDSLVLNNAPLVNQKASVDFVRHIGQYGDQTTEIIEKYILAGRTSVSIPYTFQFFDQLLNPISKPFFDSQGNPVNFHEFITEPYGNMVQIETGSSPVTGLVAEELQKYAELVQGRKVTKDFLEDRISRLDITGPAGKVKVYISFSSEFESERFKGSSGIASPVYYLDKDLVTFLLINRNISTDWISTLGVLAHEIDHAIRASINGNTIANKASTFDNFMIAIEIYRNIGGFGSIFSETEQAGVAFSTKLNFQERKAITTSLEDFGRLSAETSAETARINAISNMAKGFEKRGQRDLANFILFSINREHLYRSTFVADSIGSIYAQAYVLASQLLNFYSPTEIIDMFYNSPLTEQVTALKPIYEQIKTILLQQEVANKQILEQLNNPQLAHPVSLLQTDEEQGVVDLSEPEVLTPLVESNFIERNWYKIPSYIRTIIVRILLAPLGPAFNVSSLPINIRAQQDAIREKLYDAYDVRTAAREQVYQAIVQQTSGLFTVDKAVLVGQKQAKVKLSPQDQIEISFDKQTSGQPKIFIRNQTVSNQPQYPPALGTFEEITPEQALAFEATLDDSKIGSHHIKSNAQSLLRYPNPQHKVYAFKSPTGQIMGVAFVSEDTGFLSLLMVGPDYQQSGVGTAILNNLKQKFRGITISSAVPYNITSDTAAEYKRLSDFYKHNGLVGAEAWNPRTLSLDETDTAGQWREITPEIYNLGIDYFLVDPAEAIYALLENQKDRLPEAVRQDLQKWEEAKNNIAKLHQQMIDVENSASPQSSIPPQMTIHESNIGKMPTLSQTTRSNNSNLWATRILVGGIIAFGGPFLFALTLLGNQFLSPTPAPDFSIHPVSIQQTMQAPTYPTQQALIPTITNDSAVRIGFNFDNGQGGAGSGSLIYYETDPQDPNYVLVYAATAAHVIFGNGQRNTLPNLIEISQPQLNKAPWYTEDFTYAASADPEQSDFGMVVIRVPVAIFEAPNSPFTGILGIDKVMPWQPSNTEDLYMMGFPAPDSAGQVPFSSVIRITQNADGSYLTDGNYTAYSVDYVGGSGSVVTTTNGTIVGIVSSIIVIDGQPAVIIAPIRDFFELIDQAKLSLNR